MLVISTEMYLTLEFLMILRYTTKKSITDDAGSVCLLTNKIKHILRLWKYQFINITKMAQSESINILKFDISEIKLKV